MNEYRKYGFYQLRPSAGGLVFSTDFPYVAQACDEDIEVSWKKLKPFLSAQGRAAMRAIRQAAAKAKATQPAGARSQGVDQRSSESTRMPRDQHFAAVLSR